VDLVDLLAPLGIVENFSIESAPSIKPRVALNPQPSTLNPQLSTLNSTPLLASDAQCCYHPHHEDFPIALVTHRGWRFGRGGFGC
jgi:hypothetical protein